ncbi:DNA-directed RNA polymerase subunit beta/140 kD subunit [Thiorhodovibrio frisius]|uniref:DNA-directed RNA polymerase n=1 Tax=Thiorhodovibrio frisius TaxID=631362 RepID=H8YVT1_9GAMM|nr:DNA-directed RNA polymerase subunit beta/140 kD subunit [Thiorhodovibrio frisius]EIC24021.1 DNA-directed RNA polymerase, beta subunit/140 kD subunit [Thiorhodovibrio frisius]WPL23095.1 DNA-directed RNA polymerase subunit beta' [Thiorhodovibrio frisius]
MYETAGQPYSLDVQGLENTLLERWEAVLRPLLPTGALDLRCEVPTEAQQQACVQHNLDLRARLVVRWEEVAEPLSIPFPYPWQGVFVLATDGALQARRFTWRPWLDARPGSWQLRLTPDAEPSTRLVFLDGFYWQPPKDNQPTAKAPQRRSLPLLATAWTHTSLDRPWIPAAAQDFDDAARQVLTAHPPADKVYDVQDLSYQRLWTYGHFLCVRVLQHLYECLLTSKNTALNHKIETFLAAPSTPSPQLAADVWAHLSAPRQWDGLIPAASTLVRRGWLLPFDPINAVEALAQLHAVQRWAGTALERRPPRDRQNHPSMQGWICPVETSESPRVGIDLALARGVQVDLSGHFSRAAESPAPNETLGHAAALVPFFQHNDGARAMMAAKNLKQAVPIAGAQPPAIQTGTEQDFIDLPMAGVDLLVAYLPFFGWNYEDAIVANRRLADDGRLDWRTETTHGCYVRPGWVPTRREAWLTPGAPLDRDTPLAWFHDPRQGRDQVIVSQSDDGGQLQRLEYREPASPLLGGRLDWSIRYHRPLVVGDKLMGRYGNKGVIACFLPPERLPRLPDDPRLPPALRHRPVDLVFNPMGVVSRMNLGQLIETQATLLRALEMPGWWMAPAAGAYAPEQAPVDLGAMARAFATWGAGQTDPAIDAQGRMRLWVPLPEAETQKMQEMQGVWTEQPVTVGFQHIVRLRHHPPRKAQVRAGRGPRDRYRLSNGQPVAGRRQGGGQRIGEMEIWALAAHQARANLAAVLGYKSDPQQPLPLVAPTALASQSQTLASIGDHLYALGIDLILGNGAPRLQWLADATLCHEGREVVTRDRVWQPVLAAQWHCAQPDCAYRLPAPLTATGTTKRNDDPVPTVADVLRMLLDGAHFGEHRVCLELPETKRANVECTVAWPLRDAQGQASGTLTLAIALSKSDLKVVWTIGEESYCAYCKKTHHGQVEITTAALNALRLTCPSHRSKWLLPTETHVQSMPVTGGLADPTIVGGTALPPDSEPARAYLTLTQPLPFPRWNSRKRGQTIDERVPARQCLPVLAQRQRQPDPDLWRRDALNRDYAQLAQKPDTMAGLKGLTQHLEKRIFGKQGVVRHDGLGRRVDWSGRFVIVPDPDMAWERCGVPTATLTLLLSAQLALWPDLPAAIERALTLERGQTLPTTANAAQTWRARLLDPIFWQAPPRLAALQRRADLAHLLYWIVRAWLDAHPDTWVLLNRQPSLHRYSILAFHPHPLLPADGLVLRIHPLVCQGFGADFDGDEMTIHYPLGEDEQAEAAQLAPTRHLLSVADGAPLPAFDQDFVLGHYVLSATAAGRLEVRELLQMVDCAECAQLWSQETPWTKAHGQKVMGHLCRAHPDQVGTLIPAWMRRCFRAATLAGTSFGILDAWACQLPAEQRPPAPAAWTDGEQWNKDLAQAATAHLDAWLTEAATAGAARPGLGLAQMARSGARGTKQLRQLLAARGALLPGACGFALAEHAGRFLFDRHLVEGMSTEMTFWAAMNARSSMVDKKLLTPKAGFLTRRLVLALWGWRIRCDDCGATTVPRDVLACRCLDQDGVCAACYGSLPDGTQPPLAWPVGLVAAQSIGERGTQLSMQSFHTGTRALALDDLNGLLKLEEPVGGIPIKDAARFVEIWQSIPAYQLLDARYLRLLWYAIQRTQKRTLDAVWQERCGPLSGLAGSRQKAHLLHWLDPNTPTPAADTLPFAQVLLGQAPD